MRRTFALLALLVVLPACDLLSALSPPVADDGGTRRPDRNTDECSRDADCNGGEFCDDNGDCVVFVAEGEGEGEGEGEPPPPPPPTCGDSGCPEILSLTVNRTTLDEAAQASVSAVVTDPDGVADVIGGVLFDPTSQGTYGTFSATGTGTFQISVSWSLLNPVRAVDVDGSVTRVLRARFFDQAGHESFGDVTMTLACRNSPVACEGQCGEARCDGACFTAEDFSTDDNCGACGVTCTAPDACSSDQPSREFACLCTGPDCQTPGIPYTGTREQGVVCGQNGTCSGACCVDLFTQASSCGDIGSCSFGGAECDGPEDCGGGEECCFAGFSSSCVPGGQCRTDVNNQEVCVSTSDCLAGELCCTTSVVAIFGGDAGLCAVEAAGGGCP